ncbi:MAG: hypothetical protein WEC75_09990 [Dehalococcoidia bacterium]
MKDTTSPAPAAAPDRYQKFLPAWMQGNGAAAVRPPRPRRPARGGATRSPRGYTPGKFAANGPL